MSSGVAISPQSSHFNGCLVGLNIICLVLSWSTLLESNQRMRVLQTLALPAWRKVLKGLDHLVSFKTSDIDDSDQEPFALGVVYEDGLLVVSIGDRRDGISLLALIELLRDTIDDVFAVFHLSGAFLLKCILINSIITFSGSGFRPLRTT